MRFLIVDHYYEPVVDGIYEANPGLAELPYDLQVERVRDALFGETSFEVDALRETGHEATDWILNIRPLAEAWHREAGRSLPGPRLRPRLRRGWIPWMGRTNTSWMADSLLARVRQLQPDVVHVQCVSLVPTDVVRVLRRSVPLVVGQLAADVPTNVDLRAYGLMVSSIPGLVRRFREAGIDAELLPLAFEASLANRFGQLERDLTASFVGSISVSHPTRLSVLSAVASTAPLDIWTADTRAIPSASPLRARLHGEAFGRDMYRVMARSKIALNSHARIAEGEANNLRLFEATGMGAMLVTEAAPNLGDLFDLNSEAVTYRDPRSAAAAVSYFAEHSDEASSIAAAGQRRTLRDHNWADRMYRLAAFASARI